MIFNYLDEDRRHLLSCCIRELDEFSKNGPPPKVFCDTDIEKIFSSVEIPATMLDKAYKIIRYLGNKSKTFGESIEMDPASAYPIAYAKEKEFIFLLNYLVECDHITKDNKEVRRIVLTMEGWQKFEELEKNRIDSKQCFVAMNFDDKLDEVYEEGIKKAIEEAGYKPLRVDKEEHNEKICDRIIAEIRKSKFVVADFTGQRQGVYFEAGFAKGLDIPVIWLCRKDEVDEKKLHFDTQQYNHITWENSDDLYEQLRLRIDATIT